MFVRCLLGASAGGQRINTGFFVIKTTEFARDFIETAWRINDCGRGESDQRSMNFVLGNVNWDDTFCTAEVLKQLPTRRMFSLFMGTRRA